jgi:hypothetical protein
MHVITVASQKGGVSKSTLCQCLAVEALKEGRRAAIIDMDPQQSVARWGARRAAAGIAVPAVIAAAEKPVKGVVRDLEKQGAAMVMIDTPPLVTPQLSTTVEFVGQAACHGGGVSSDRFWRWLDAGVARLTRPGCVRASGRRAVAGG